MVSKYLDYHSVLRPGHTDRLKSAHTQHQKVWQALTAISVLTPQNAEVQEQVEAARQDSGALQQSLDSITRSEFFNEQCPTHAKDVAQKVFDVPEILEMILLNLGHAAELLSAQIVNRQFRDAVLGSVQLRRMMGLEAQPNAGFQPLLLWLEHFSCDFSNRVVLDAASIAKRDAGTGHYAGLEVSFNHNHRATLRIGARIRSLLVCQPPITEMRAFATCCMPRTAQRMPTFAIAGVAKTVVNAAGITIGDLQDAEAEIKREHHECAHAWWRCHDDEGKVMVRAIFHSFVELDKADPIVSRRAAEARVRAEGQRAFKLKRERYKAFVAAKEEARGEGRAVPSLAEHEASLAAVETDAGEA